MNRGQMIVNIDPAFLWFFVAVAILIFFLNSWILNYHWKSYGSDEKLLKATKSIFWFGSIVLILIMLFTLSLYDFGI